MERTALWTPQSKPQWLAALSPADELLYGGSAGGGKTDLILGLATEEHHKSIIFRREYPQLKDVIDRGNEILAPYQVTFNAQQQRWALPGGRRIELGAVLHEKDLSKYKGRPHDLIAIDEAADFPERFVRFLVGWLRTTVPGQRTRLLMCSNPPTTPEGEWIVRYFAPWLDPQHPNPARPGELRWFAVISGRDTEVAGPEPFQVDGEWITPKSRTFIPARLADNPYLRDTEYGAVLQNLPEPLRSQLLYGTFDLKLEDNPWQVIPTAWIEAAQRRWEQGTRPDLALRASGLDVARGGDDNTVLARLYGEWIEMDSLAGRDCPDGPTAATWALQQVGVSPSPMGVDVIGVGASAYDVLAATAGVQAVPINFAEGSKMRDKTGRFGMANVRAAAYWSLREALDPTSEHVISLPPDRDLRIDLGAPRYKVTARGIQIEAKDDIKARIGRSPDMGDAVALAWYTAQQAVGFTLFET